MKIEKITIIGLGLIGGSWGMALKKNSPEYRICGVDREREIIDKALAKGCIDEGSLELEEACADADLIVLAVLVSGMKELGAKIAPFLKKGAILTDVGSTKSGLNQELKKIIPPTAFYIGGHPMAGAESQGIESAQPYLFENAVYVLTPDADIPQEKTKELAAVIKKLGANVQYLSPEEHDLMVAAISHLPHALASSLVYAVGQMEEKKKGILRLAAGGFRDVTRIADSQPEMWKDIFLANSESVLYTLKVFKQSLAELEEAIKEKNAEAILRILGEAREKRQELPEKIKSVLPENYEVLVTVPDQPGSIGILANSLAEAEINILDIEIMRVRDEAGGTMKFGFADKESAVRALEVFASKGVSCYLK